MTTKRCPILFTAVLAPCHREPCDACREEFEERSAIIQYATHPPLASTSFEADRLAREQLADLMPGQRVLSCA